MWIKAAHRFAQLVSHTPFSMRAHAIYCHKSVCAACNCMVAEWRVTLLHLRELIVASESENTTYTRPPSIKVAPCGAAVCGRRCTGARHNCNRSHNNNKSHIAQQRRKQRQTDESRSPIVEQIAAAREWPSVGGLCPVRFCCVAAAHLACSPIHFHGGSSPL